MKTTVTAYLFRKLQEHANTDHAAYQHVARVIAGEVTVLQAAIEVGLLAKPRIRSTVERYIRRERETCREAGKVKVPVGSGQKDYPAFVALLRAKLGDRVADLVIVSPPQKTGPKVGDGVVSPHDAEKLKTKDKDTRLRAILRAPESIQSLYREGLIPQTEAAKLGPKSPTPEQAAKVAEARTQIDALDRKQKPAEFRKKVKAIIASTLGSSKSTVVQQFEKLWKRATKVERE